MHNVKRSISVISNLSRNSSLTSGAYELTSISSKGQSGAVLSYKNSQRIIRNLNYGQVYPFRSLNTLSLCKTSAVTEYRFPLGARFFSSKKDDTDKESDGEDSPGKEEPVINQTHLPATVAVPEVWPQLPVIAISRNPVFPRFIKLVEVSYNNSTPILIIFCIRNRILESK